MKSLSLKQPFAELILKKKKTIELRGWNTKFRGEFLIHSSKNPDRNAMKKFGFVDLPCGFILGKAEIIDVKHYKSEEEHIKDRNKHLADSTWGKYGFLLKNVQKFEKPIPASGKLRFWEFTET